jgi:hypothetical protein
MTGVASSWEEHPAERSGEESSLAALYRSGGASEQHAQVRAAERQASEMSLADELSANRQFPAGVELRYSWRSGAVTYIGTGRTKELSAGSVCFETDQEVRGGTEVELRIAWPSRLQRICPLELVLRGPLVRKARNLAILRTVSYEFQTCGDRSFAQSGGCGITCDVAA